MLVCSRVIYKLLDAGLKLVGITNSPRRHGTRLRGLIQGQRTASLSDRLNSINLSEKSGCVEELARRRGWCRYEVVRVRASWSAQRHLNCLVNTAPPCVTKRVLLCFIRLAERIGSPIGAPMWSVGWIKYSSSVSARCLQMI